jgi:YihY family inner membrane protein
VDPYGAGERLRAVRSRIDGLQRRHAVVGFAYAVVRKYVDDEGGRLAALLTYYGFLSAFPLLLIAVAVATQVLASYPELRDELIDTLLGPALQQDIEQALANLPPSGLPLAIGVAGLLFTGTGGVLAGRAALDRIWAVPRGQRFSLLRLYARVFLMLALLLVGAVTIAGLAAISSEMLHRPTLQRIASVAGSYLIVLVVLICAHRILTASPPPIANLWVGCALGALAVTALVHLGATLLPAVAAGYGPVYGSFATVVGAFTLLYVTSQVVILSAEMCAVQRFRLWPRAAPAADPTDADVLAVVLIVRERVPDQRVQVSVAPRHPPDRQPARRAGADAEPDRDDDLPGTSTRQS